MKAIAVIPARFASSRFPGKPLANQTGKFLIQHVCERVAQARRVDSCIVATDDERIFDATRSFGATAVMTSPTHESGTDRIAEVVRGMPDDDRPDIVLNVQGDEPEIEPAYLDRLVDALTGDAGCAAATLACPFPASADPRDPNCVKVVRNRAGRALYFSRALIPYPRADVAESDQCGWLLHLGVYAYRRDFLLEFAGWPQSALERIERLEQLRILDHGRAMAVEVVENASVGIDTPEDYASFVERLRG